LGHGSLTFGWDSADRFLSDDGLELAQRHYDEIAHDKADVPLEIDIDDYLKREKDGTFRIFAARRDGRLVGYVFFDLFWPSRYRTTLHVKEHIFWLAPEERKGMTGYRLLKAAFSALPKPCKLQVHEKLSFEGGRVGKLVERLGLKPIDVVYGAYLRE